MHSEVSERDRQRMARIEGVSAIASIVLDELRYGALRLPEGQRRTDLLGMLDELVIDGLPVLPFDRNAAERARLESLSQTPPFADGQIAAVAAVNDLTLVTHNLRDFEAFEGLRVEDW